MYDIRKIITLTENKCIRTKFKMWVCSDSFSRLNYIGEWPKI